MKKLSMHVVSSKMVRFLVVLWFSPVLTAGHFDLGLRSEFVHRNKLKLACDINQHATCGCKNSCVRYPNLFLGQELIVALPNANGSDEHLFHVWNPAGFAAVCNDSEYDGRRFFYVDAQFLNHQFENHGLRVPKNCFHELLGIKTSCKTNNFRIRLNNRSDFEYDITHNNVGFLIREIRIDMFLQFLVQPLLVSSDLQLDGWNLTQANDNFITFKRENLPPLTLDLKTIINDPHELVDEIDQFLCANGGICTLAKTLTDIDLESFDAPYTFTTLNNSDVERIMQTYLKLLKMLVPADVYTRGTYGVMFITLF